MSRPLAAALALLALPLAACRATITPPANPPDPVTVALVDYGHHGSLVLPAPGGSVEFAYGQWDWFARNRTSVWQALRTIFPRRSTLARRDLPVPPDAASLRGAIWAEKVIEIRVAGERAAALRDALEARWRRKEETKVHNPETGLDHVKDDVPYACWDNCNHVLLEWVEELGCDVGGCRFFANFVLRQP